jgi:modification methylase
VLSDGTTYRLLGVKEKKGADEKAREFLLSKLKGARVFTRYDSVRYDDDGNVLCYLYLRNRTFINAHLIKKKLADVNTSMDYRYKHRFMKLQDERMRDG